MSKEGMRRPMITAGVLMKGVLWMSALLFPLVWVETPAQALNCELDRRTATCILSMTPQPLRSHKPFTFQLELKSKEFFGIRVENGREYLPPPGPSTPAIWDPVFEIMDWEVWARIPTGFSMVASGGGASGTVTVTHGGGFILHATIRRRGMEKRHVPLPDGGTEEIEVPTEILFGTDHHEFHVSPWCVDATGDFQAMRDEEDQLLVLPLGTVPVPVFLSSPDSHLIKIRVQGPPPPVPAFVAFLVHEEGGGHEEGLHDPFRPLGRLVPPSAPPGSPLGKIVQIVPYAAAVNMVYGAGHIGGSGNLAILISDKPFVTAAMPSTTLKDQYAQRQAVVDEFTQILEQGKGCAIEGGAFSVCVKPGLELLPESPFGDYVLTGANPSVNPNVRHVGNETNHWGTNKLNDAIELVAEEYRNTGPKILGVFEPALGINDMSLGCGGLFDVFGDWKIPHKLHRTGASVDIDRNVTSADPLCPGSLICRREVNRTVLRNIFATHGGMQYPEAQIHFDVE